MATFIAYAPMQNPVQSRTTARIPQNPAHFKPPLDKPWRPSYDRAPGTPGAREDAEMRHAWIAVVLALTFAVLPAGSGSSAVEDKPIELKFSSWVGTVHGHHTGVMAPWAKMIEEKSGGKLKVTIYPGSTLGKAADHYDMVKDGIAERASGIDRHLELAAALLLDHLRP